MIEWVRCYWNEVSQSVWDSCSSVVLRAGQACVCLSQMRADDSDIHPSIVVLVSNAQRSRNKNRGWPTETAGRAVVLQWINDIIWVEWPWSIILFYSGMHQLVSLY